MFWYEYLYNACFGILQRRIPRILQRVACANLYGPYWYCVLLKYASFGMLLINNILQLKQRLQLLTLGIGGVGVVSAYVSYSPEIAARLIFLLI